MGISSKKTVKWGSEVSSWERLDDSKRSRGSQAQYNHAQLFHSVIHMLLGPHIISLFCKRSSYTFNRNTANSLPYIFFLNICPPYFPMHRKIIWLWFWCFFPDLEFFPCSRCQINPIALSERPCLRIMNELVIYKFCIIRKPRKTSKTMPDQKWGCQ